MFKEILKDISMLEGLSVKNTNAHWTEKSLSDFIYRVGADFVFQLDNKIDSQKALAETLSVTKSAVSQKLNNPGNLKLETMVKYARALGLKVSVVLYDDGDRDNERGPINSDIFRICWENAGKPKDFWQATSDWVEGVSVNYEVILETNLKYPACPTRAWESLVYKPGNLAETVTITHRRMADTDPQRLPFALHGGT
ncbi:helix-turn-helix transcriptional regulator [Candidatus Nitrospira nitrificans]|uniref:HTH cro/C1-type domain-containing protein n=1 Tax=Candidatus Nitrospira nitrificans TaxID=1742973 RepID=A0A0S4L8G6_9BACT|nr:helix-turn-helix transcriptional regulator [Candidatus Nitrospira nitrificans]CUS33503.1 hypothetical protein COMA2_130096 [Candidatus Nitrospira nitrificans]